MGVWVAEAPRRPSGRRCADDRRSALIWLSWRQFRAQAVAALALLTAAAIGFLITGSQLRRTYLADLASCVPHHSCDSVLGQTQYRYDTPLNLTQLLVIGAPALVGMFWGAPLIG